MEVIRKNHFTLKQIFRDNWGRFLEVYPTPVTWFVAYNVWKILNCREPDSLGYATYACPDQLPNPLPHVEAKLQAAYP